MHVQRVQQISESHCGPAVLQMLLNSLGIVCTQDEIVKQADAAKTVEADGVRVDQMVQASQKIAPQTQFWYKYHATIDDIRYILQRGYCVGVEWQGLFYESEEEEKEEEGEENDHGHYSVVSYVDETLQVMIIVDPYKDFADQDRIFEIPTFMHRWWDTNEVVDQYTGHKHTMRDEQLLFFITPTNESFPAEKGFKRFGSSV